MHHHMALVQFSFNRCQMVLRPVGFASRTQTPQNWTILRQKKIESLKGVKNAMTPCQLPSLVLVYVPERSTADSHDVSSRVAHGEKTAASTGHAASWSGRSRAQSTGVSEAKALKACSSERVLGWTDSVCTKNRHAHTRWSTVVLAWTGIVSFQIKWWSQA